jgi:hypothetical protein
MNQSFRCVMKAYMRGSKRLWRSWEVPHVCQSATDIRQWEDQLMFELRKREADGSLPKAKDEFLEPWFAKHAPAVGMVVFQSAFPDGTARKSGFFTMWRSPDGVTVKITDNEVMMSWQYSHETFEGAIKLAEKALQGGMPGNRAFSSKSNRRK